MIEKIPLGLASAPRVECSYMQEPHIEEFYYDEDLGAWASVAILKGFSPLQLKRIYDRLLHSQWEAWPYMSGRIFRLRGVLLCKACGEFEGHNPTCETCWSVAQ